MLSWPEPAKVTVEPGLTPPLSGPLISPSRWLKFRLLLDAPMPNAYTSPQALASVPPVSGAKLKLSATHGCGLASGHFLESTLGFCSIHIVSFFWIFAISAAGGPQGVGRSR